MDNLIWTTEIPTENGYYWARGVFRITVVETEEIVNLVEIIGIGDDEVFICGDDVGIPIKAFTHWMGPLQIHDKPSIQAQ